MHPLLTPTYRNPEHPASFGGVTALHRALKGRVKTKEIKKWLSNKESYSLHKQAQRKFQRNRILVRGIDAQFQSDLVDMQNLARYNNGYKYILTCIDVFSKYAWAIPLKDKTGTNVVSALRTIFSERKPQVLQTDKGKEFTNKVVQNFLKRENVHFFTTENSTVKASIVERFHRTLKFKMWKYFTEMNTYKYIDVLDKLVKSYNHTWHSSIQTEPVQVNGEKEKQIWALLYKSNVKVIPKLKVGDTVRISKLKMIFEKGYEHNWTREIFTVHEILPRNPPVYRLKDLAGEVIQGTFYEKELQKVTDSGYYPVEKVLRERQRNGKTEYFVKFQGYPDKFNDWVSDVKMI